MLGDGDDAAASGAVGDDSGDCAATARSIQNEGVGKPRCAGVVYIADGHVGRGRRDSHAAGGGACPRRERSQPQTVAIRAGDGQDRPVRHSGVEKRDGFVGARAALPVHVDGRIGGRGIDQKIAALAVEQLEFLDRGVVLPIIAQIQCLGGAVTGKAGSVACGLS